MGKEIIIGKSLFNNYKVQRENYKFTILNFIITQNIKKISLNI